MAAITHIADIAHIGHDELGFPKPLLASVKLLAFLAFVLVVLFAVPLAAAAGVYHLIG